MWWMVSIVILCSSDRISMLFFLTHSAATERVTIRLFGFCGILHLLQIKTSQSCAHLKGTATLSPCPRTHLQEAVALCAKIRITLPGWTCIQMPPLLFSTHVLPPCVSVVTAMALFPPSSHFSEKERQLCSV